VLLLSVYIRDSTKTCRKSGVKDDACGSCHVPGSFDI
jgi:hypothetical protein